MHYFWIEEYLLDSLKALSLRDRYCLFEELTDAVLLSTQDAEANEEESESLT